MVSPSSVSVFGSSNSLAKRVLAIVAIGLWSTVVLAFLVHLVEEAVRQPPALGDLAVVQGVFKAGGNCGGKGRLRGFDVSLLHGNGERTVRLPCIPELESLSAGQPLTLHMQEVAPLLGWPAYAELWHATSGSSVLYSYESRRSREHSSAWLGYALAALAWAILVPLSWRLSRWAWRETTAQAHGNEA